MFVLVVEASSQPEELNKKAVAILNRVRDKLTGICTMVPVQLNSVINNLLLFWQPFCVWGLCGKVRESVESVQWERKRYMDNMVYGLIMYVCMS